MLSAVLSGSKVRVLVNDDGLEPTDTAEIITLASPSDKGVFPLIHMTSVSTTATAVSVAARAYRLLKEKRACNCHTDLYT